MPSSGDQLTSRYVGSRFSVWLLRPYLDLGPFHLGPLHVSCVEECWRALTDPSSEPFVAQRALPPAFRRQLVDEAGTSYALNDPRELSEELRTLRWRELCQMLDGWDRLSLDCKCRLASLLHSMCLYGPLLALIQESVLQVEHAEPKAVELAFWQASARFMQGLRHGTARYHDADMSVFERIARRATHAVLANFNATAMVFVHKAKTGAALSELCEWAKRYEAALVRAVDGLDEFNANLLTSRFYRGVGFLPQRRGNRSGVIQTMDLAERHARAMQPATAAQRILYRENLHALFESRTKEALWLGDRKQALARSLEVTEVDPYDSKAWVELGEVRHLRKELQEAAQAYIVAATLGPPADAVGRHMAGLCYRELGQDLLAALLFKDALELDPLGISPRQEISELPPTVVLKALMDWARNTVEW
jgi:tetratricopeptide (TPR) repeat protein